VHDLRTDGTGRPVGARPPAAALGSGSIATTAIGPLILGDGTVLPDVHVAWRHDGPPPPAPQILVVHALTGSADAAGDWWAPLIGPGKGIDTRTHGVLCANLLGSRYGTTGPASIDPETGVPWADRFPAVTPREQADVLWRLADALGIPGFAAVTGGSLGGMVALEAGLLRPDATGLLAIIAAPAATGALAIAWNHLQVRLVERLGVEGLALARQIAMTTYRSETDFDARFGRRREEDGRFSMVSYLEHQGTKLVDRFDPDTYRVLAGAMDRHDIGAGRGGVDAALASIAGRVPLAAIGIEDDILYGPRQVRALADAAAAAGVATTYREIRSTKGHDAFLVEWDQLTVIFRELLGGTARPSDAEGASVRA